MRRVARFMSMLLLAGVFAAGMLFGAWWTIPLIAAAYALVVRTRRAPVHAMIGALLGTLALLLRHMVLPSFARLLAALDALFPIPGVAVLGLSLLLAMVLAYTAARVVTGLVGVRDAAT